MAAIENTSYLESRLGIRLVYSGPSEFLSHLANPSSSNDFSSLSYLSPFPAYTYWFQKLESIHIRSFLTIISTRYSIFYLILSLFPCHFYAAIVQCTPKANLNKNNYKGNAALYQRTLWTVLRPPLIGMNFGTFTTLCLKCEAISHSI